MTHKLFWVGIFLGLLLLWVFPFQDGLSAQDEVGINKIVICEDVVDRSPVNPGTEFGTDVGRLYCFTAVKNSGPKATIIHVWKHEGKVRSRVDMSVGTSANWRTWSLKTLEPQWTGSWSVTVLDEAGVELAKTDFTLGYMEAAPKPEPEEPVMEEEMEAPEVPEEVPEPPEMEEEPPEMMTEEEMTPMETIPEEVPEPPEMEAPEVPEEAPEPPEMEEEPPEVMTEEEMMPMETAPEDTMMQDTSGTE